MKTKELRKLSIEQLNKKLEEIEFEQIRSSSLWGKSQVDKKKAGVKYTGKGENTKLQKNIRITIARIKTLINEKEHEK
jgi:ribosomal protein L29